MYKTKAKIIIYIDGSTSTIRPIVADHREIISRRDLIFDDIAHYARTKGEADHTCGKKSAYPRYFSRRPTEITAAQKPFGASNTKDFKLMEFEHNINGCLKCRRSASPRRRSMLYKERHPIVVDIMNVDVKGKRHPRPLRVHFQSLQNMARVGERFLRVEIFHNYYEKGNIKPKLLPESFRRRSHRG